MGIIWSGLTPERGCPHLNPPIKQERNQNWGSISLGIIKYRKGAKGKKFPCCARDKSPTMFETSIKRKCRSIAVFGIEKNYHKDYDETKTREHHSWGRGGMK